MQFSVHTPTNKGQIITPLASCVQFLDEMSYLKELKYKAETVRAQPPTMVSHVIPPKKSGLNDVMPSMDLIAGASDDVINQDLINDSLNKVRVEYVEALPFTSSKSDGEGAYGNNPFKDDALLERAAIYKEETRRQFTFLPKNHAYVQQQLPQVPTDYCKLMYEHEARIRRTLGVHSMETTISKGTDTQSSLSKSKSHTHMTHNENTHLVNTAMVHRYRSDINSFLKRCYDISTHMSQQHNRHLLKQYTVSLRASPFTNIHLLEIACEKDILDKYKVQEILSEMLQNTT